MNLKRVAPLPVLAGILVLGFAIAGPVSAQDYGGNCVLEASGTGLPGSDVTVSGSGFEPNLVTQLVFTDDDSSDVLGSIVVEGDGTFGPLVFQLPATITGDTFTLSAACDAEGRTAQDVLGTRTGRTGAPRGDRTGGLSRTGSDTVPLLVAGGVTLVVGTGVLLVARRRRLAAAS